MKLCKDCKWFDEQTDECHHESAIKRDPVYGNDRYFLASTHREYTGRKDCTVDARFWEEKEPSLFTISGGGIKVGRGP